MCLVSAKCSLSLWTKQSAEHILLGIVRDGGGVGADILDTLGVLGKVREQVFELLG
jgi:hypothetical protein